MENPQELNCLNSEGDFLHQPEGSSQVKDKSKPTRQSAKNRIVHPGEALGIHPKLRPHPYEATLRYQKGDMDVDSIIAFLSHLRENNDMPKDILRVRGRIRNPFPGVGCTKPMIRAAYEKAGWSMNEICWLTKKEKKGHKFKISSKKYRDLPVC